MCEAPFPAWAMVTFGTVVLLLGLELGLAIARVHDLWRRGGK